MLLRLGVRGFKNLRDVDIRFGPLTCFVGPNGVGKSNVFDAIQFLRYLADDDIQHAAEHVRGPAAGSYSPLELFWNNDPLGKLELEADMLVPISAEDDFGEPVEPTTSLLRYSIQLSFEEKPRPRLVLIKEELVHLLKGKAKGLIGFPHTKAFLDSVVRGRRGGTAFISTTSENGRIVVQIHQDGGSRGRPIPIGPSPKTILAGTTSAAYPTVMAARREMSSWHSLHLEPSSLRTPDRFSDPASVDEHGRHIASTLDRIARGRYPGDPDERLAVGERPPDDAASVFQEVTNRLGALVPEIHELRVDRDNLRQQLAVQVRMKGSDIWLSPRSLSDGTLRFLALVTMQADTDSSRVLCMEEPENGIHPLRVPALIEVLRDYVVDPDEVVSDDNPLRQLVLNTHSSEVLRHLDVPEILFVDTVHSEAGREAAVRPILADGNWRDADLAVDLRALEEAIQGSPLSRFLSERQLDLKFEAPE